MKSGRQQITEGTKQIQGKIKTLGEKETYKKLRIMEADIIKQAEIEKKSISGEWENYSKPNTSSGSCTWDHPQMIDKRTGRLENKRTNSDYTNYSIIRIRRNIGKSPGHLRRLAVIQIPLGNHQLTLIGKTRKLVNNNNYLLLLLLLFFLFCCHSCWTLNYKLLS